MSDARDNRRAQHALLVALGRNRGEIDAQRLAVLLAPLRRASATLNVGKTGAPAEQARPL